MFTDGQIQVSSFYKFSPFTDERIAAITAALQNLEKTDGLHGLVILGHEGINTTLSFEKSKATELKARIFELLNLGEIPVKDSFTHKHPFSDLKVKVRPEIVTLGRSDLVPQAENHHHLTPAEWNQVMKNEDVVIIDTRNDYEYQIGHFKGALNPNTREFTEFPKYLEEHNIPKDKKVLIYCTGGIRCEKAILEMNDQGFDNVYQLRGGILNYLEQFPNDQWKGECFVFDYRVAVDQDLKPTTIYKLCPHCGQPGKTPIECVQCGIDAVLCEACLNDGRPDHQTCSKNCAHHHRMGHKTTRIHWDGLRN